MSEIVPWTRLLLTLRRMTLITASAGVLNEIKQLWRKTDTKQLETKSPSREGGYVPR